MSFSMFYTGLSGLNVAQTALVTTGHNTANVNTPGYSRQSAQIASSGGTYLAGTGFVGNGAQATDVTRSYDQFLTTQLNQAQASSASLSTQYAQISQLDSLLANQTAGLAPMMQAFFAGIQTVADTPADPASRQQLIGAGEAMTNQFRAMSAYLGGLNTNVNEQIAGNVAQINTYAEQIASLNKQIALVSNAAGGQAPNDLLDQRDQLVSGLSQLVGTKVVTQAGGQYSVFIGNGQTLVLGDKAATLQAVASAADPSRSAVAMTGASGVAIELQDSVMDGGSLGGLLQFRNETLGAAQNALGRIAIVLGTSFNAQQALGVDLNGNMGAQFFTQASPAVVANDANKGNLTLSASFADVSELGTSDYRLSVAADGSYQLLRLSDQHAFDLTGGFPVTVDGVKLTIDSGTAQPGDVFLIQPTRAGARDFGVLVNDPSQIAAAAPVIVDSRFGNRGSGSIQVGSIDASYTPIAPVTLRYDSATQSLSGFPANASVTVTLADGSPDPASPYSIGSTSSTIAYSAGARLNFNGISVTLGGSPADGDTFTISHNSSGASDGRNALLLANLQNQKTIGGRAASFNDAYAQLVSTIGNKTRQIEISNTAQSSLTAQIRTAQQSVSGVNQDEETANLLMYQQMYQANAKVIQTASTLFDAILGIHG